MKDMYKFHIDPKRKWLEVPMEELEELDIAHRISDDSLRCESICYLEEDCDMAKFMIAFAEHKGYAPDLEEVPMDIPLNELYRSYYV